jgi:hypothetical protein
LELPVSAVANPPRAIAGLRDAAFVVARAEISDAVVEAINADGRSLREIGRATGLDVGFLSRLASGKRSATVASLALVALALGKTLKISIE